MTTITPKTSDTARADLWAFAIILVSLAARLAFAATGQLDLVQDETQYWDWSRRLQISYYSKGPLVAYLISAGTALFGNTQLGVRIASILCGISTMAVLHLGLSRLFLRPWAGVWAVAMAATMPLLMGLSLLMTTDSPLALCWTAAFFALYAAGRGRYGIWPYVVLAVATMLGVLAKYMMLAFAGVAVAYMLLLPLTGQPRPKGVLLKTLAALTVGMAVGMAPILAWNSANGWVGFKHVEHLAMLSHKGAGEPWWASVSLHRVPDFLGGQTGLASPWWMWFMVLGCWRAVRACRGRGPAAGLETDQALLGALAFAPMLLFFFVWSFHTWVYANWTAMAYLGGVVLGGAAFAEFAAARPPRKWAAWPALGIVIFLATHLVVALPLPDKANPALRLMGFSDLGRQLGRLAVSEFDDPRRVLYMSGNYGLAATQAFHVPGQPVAYQVPGGRRLSQYDLWPVPGPEQTGYDAIYVRKDERRGIPKELPEMFQSVERRVCRTTHKGRPGRVFTVYLCHNFNGRWPKMSGNQF